jgi:hypothetical protein
MTEDRFNFPKFKGTEVTLRPHENESQLIRRFIRMTKKEHIVEEYLDATKEHIKPAEALRIKQKNAKIRRIRREARLKKKQTK